MAVCERKLNELTRPFCDKGSAKNKTGPSSSSYCASQHCARLCIVIFVVSPHGVLVFQYYACFLFVPMHTQQLLS